MPTVGRIPGLRVALVCWETVGQVGGIATHLTRWRDAGRKAGDRVDVLFSGPRARDKPGIYPARKRVKNKDNWIWCDGSVPHHPDNVSESVRFLDRKYDLVVFGFPCPAKTKKFPLPLFRPLYDCRPRKIMAVMDGYWDTYADRADPLVHLVDAVVVPQPSYGLPLEARRVIPTVVRFPFAVPTGFVPPDRSAAPLVVWPNQWKSIKGVKPFVWVLPDVVRRTAGCRVELYGCGIEYYQVRKTEEWAAAVNCDFFGGAHGDGVADYFGQIETDDMHGVYARAWFTVNLQGMTGRNPAYKTGSYNNTEVEALYHGAMPVLHSTFLGTGVPSDLYCTVRDATDIPQTVFDMVNDGRATDPDRRRRAREFVSDVHDAEKIWKQLISL